MVRNEALHHVDGNLKPERSGHTHGFGRQTAPVGIQVYNPAFDVTPAKLITAVICERGVIRPVIREVIAEVIDG